MNRKIIDEAVAFCLVHRDKPGTAGFLWDQNSYGKRAPGSDVVHGCLALALALRHRPEEIVWSVLSDGEAIAHTRDVNSCTFDLAVEIADLTDEQGHVLFSGDPDLRRNVETAAAMTEITREALT